MENPHRTRRNYKDDIIETMWYNAPHAPNWEGRETENRMTDTATIPTAEVWETLPDKDPATGETKYRRSGGQAPEGQPIRYRRKPEADNRGHLGDQLGIRVTKAERHEAEEKAAAENTTISNWGRRRMFGEEAQPGRRPNRPKPFASNGKYRRSGGQAAEAGNRGRHLGDQITIRVTKAERRQWAESAAAENATLSDWARRRMFGEEAQPGRRPNRPKPATGSNGHRSPSGGTDE